MKAEIKSWYSADVDVDSYSSKDPSDDAVWVRIICGPFGEPGEESFDILVCTPDSLKPQLGSGAYIMGRHMLFQERLDLSAAYRFIEKYVNSIEGKNWREVAEKISRLGMWEFEDYSA